MFKELETAFLTKLDILSISRKVSSEYFNTFYESRRAFELFYWIKPVQKCVLEDKRCVFLKNNNIAS